VTQIGVTGHQQLPAEAINFAVRGIQRIFAAAQAPLTGLSSLAAGADQLFATELIAAGGQLHVVVPASGYENTFSDEDAARYCDLLGRASNITHLPYDEPSEEAYDAAGLWIVERCDLLIAVWDGEPARGLGGTADAVAHANRLGRTVHILWPEGVRRE
jgi:hypothetical protein